MKKIVVFTVAFALVAFSSGCFAQGEASAGDLFEAKCSKCHPTERAKGEKKDVTGWTSTVNRMKGKLTGHISDADAEAIIKYLTENYSR